MTPGANAITALIAALLFIKVVSLYPEAGSRIYSGFLLGISVSFFFGAYWHHTFSENWKFYRKFYSIKTKQKQRMKMLNKIIDHELPTYIAAVLFGFILVYLSTNNFIWLASGMFFGFIFGGSLAMAIVLRDLN